MKAANPEMVLNTIPAKGLARTSLTASPGLRSRVGNVLTYFLSALLFVSAFLKFAVPKVIEQMGMVGFAGGRLHFIAVLEILSALLFVNPKTRSFGLLMVSAYLGGAIAAHVGHNQLGFQPAIVLSLFWLATWLRHPETFAGKN
jgi:sorbitol-specific phosphotransferase system component IIC